MGEVPLHPPVPLGLGVGVQGTLAARGKRRVNPTVDICLGTYGDPMGVGFSYERGTPVLFALPVNRLTARLEAFP